MEERKRREGKAKKGREKKKREEKRRKEKRKKKKEGEKEIKNIYERIKRERGVVTKKVENRRKGEITITTLKTNKDYKF